MVGANLAIEIFALASLSLTGNAAKGSIQFAVFWNWNTIVVAQSPSQEVVKLPEHKTESRISRLNISLQIRAFKVYLRQGI